MNSVEQSNKSKGESSLKGTDGHRLHGDHRPPAYIYEIIDYKEKCQGETVQDQLTAKWHS
jgi:hypothetical protein